MALEIHQSSGANCLMQRPTGLVEGLAAAGFVAFVDNPTAISTVQEVAAAGPGASAAK